MASFKEIAGKKRRMLPETDIEMIAFKKYYYYLIIKEILKNVKY